MTHMEKGEKNENDRVVALESIPTHLQVFSCKAIFTYEAELILF